MRPVEEQHYQRQLGLLSVTTMRAARIGMIGVGAVGSMAACTFAKMGLGGIHCYDHDTVEMHNIPCQAYRLADVGKYKVDALRELCGATITPHVGRFELGASPGLSTDMVLLSAVDSMAARHAIWSTILRGDVWPRWYLDARMGAEVCSIYTVDLHHPEQFEAYEHTLYPDADALYEPCTARSIAYTPMFAAGLLGNQVKRLLLRQAYRTEIIFSCATTEICCSPLVECATVTE